MNAHLSKQVVERYRQRALSRSELLDADDHIAACEICRQRLADEEHVQAAVRSLRTDLAATGLTHLSYEQLLSYVEGADDPTDREIADSHLDLCPQCATELDELRAFASEMAANPASDDAPAVPSSPGEKVPSTVKGWREAFQGFWRSPAFWLPVRLASFGLIIALLFWAALLKSQNSRLQTALDGERQENEKLKQDYEAANASVTELQNQVAQLKSIEPSLPAGVVRLVDGGGVVTLDKEGNVAGVPPTFQETVKQTLTAQRIETPKVLSRLIGKSGVLMGPAEQGHPIALVAPVGTVVMSDRPTLRWREFSGAGYYVVKIYGADFNEVSASPQLSGTAWTVPHPLERGRTYSWQVMAKTGEKEVLSPVKPAPDARFMVLDQGRVSELTKAHEVTSGSHLTLGILYAQAGLLDDAESEFQALLHANPRSALAEKLLRSVRAKRRT